MDPTKKMSKSLGEKHVLYLFDEDYMGKLKKANMNDEGLKNIQLIASNLGLNYQEYSLNLQLKEAIAVKMDSLFSEKVIYL